MQHVVSIELKRDCEAVQIPAGNSVTLPAGTPADITQTLGGTYTIHTQGGLFRIAAGDADALGIEQGAGSSRDEPAREGVATEEQVWAALRTCFDPEIPLNIVDLGLIYDLQVNRQPGKGSSVLVRMTLTAPGCGMGAVIAGDAQQKLLSLPGVQDARVEIVWEPPWHHSMISAEGRRVLGLD